MNKFVLSIFLFSSMGLSAQLSEQNLSSHSSESAQVQIGNHFQKIQERETRINDRCIPSCPSIRGCACAPIYGSFYLVTSQPIRLSPGEAIPFDELTAVKTHGLRVSPHTPGEIIFEDVGDYLLTYAASVIGASPHLEMPRTALTFNNTTIIPGSEVRYTVESTLSPTISKIIRISTVPATVKFINHTPYQDIIINSIDNEVAAFLLIQKIDN